MLIKPWEFFLQKVRGRHPDNLIDEISKVLGEGALAYAVNQGGADRRGLSQYFQNNPHKKEPLCFIATTIRYLAQTMSGPEIKVWFMEQRDVFDDFTVTDMIRDGYREEIIELAENPESSVAQSA